MQPRRRSSLHAVTRLLLLLVAGVVVSASSSCALGDDERYGRACDDDAACDGYVCLRARCVPDATFLGEGEGEGLVAEGEGEGVAPAEGEGEGAPGTDCVLDDDCTNTGNFCDAPTLCINGLCVVGEAPCAPDSPTPFCDEPNDRCIACRFSSDCDDDAYCTGQESCVDGACRSSGDPCVGRSLTCDEEHDACSGCTSNGRCDDRIACNGNESCDPVTQRCVAGTPRCGAATPRCDIVADRCTCDASDTCPDDGLFCTGAPQCGDSGACQQSGNPCGALRCCEDSDTCAGCCVDADCNDGDACSDDVCVAGTCQHEPRVCDDSNPCTDDTCGVNGCVFTPKECTDFNPCTIDTCTDGVCQHAPKQCANGCSPTTGECLGCTNAQQCVDDGLFCTGTPVCSGASTQGPGTCGQTGTPCTAAGRTHCCEATDRCVRECCSDAECNDNDACTIDSCSPEGTCVRTAKCSDNNPCTVDQCSGGACSFQPLACPGGCDPNTGACFQCNSASQCGATTFCNGSVVCVNNTCGTTGSPCVDPAPVCCEGAAQGCFDATTICP